MSLFPRIEGEALAQLRELLISEVPPSVRANTDVELAADVAIAAMNDALEAAGRTMELTSPAKETTRATVAIMFFRSMELTLNAGRSALRATLAASLLHSVIRRARQEAGAAPPDGTSVH